MKSSWKQVLISILELKWSFFGLALTVGLLSGTTSSQAWAWGKSGHEIVTRVAARLLYEKEHIEFMGQHSFDLGYYANVPDIIWRNMGEEVNQAEAPQHYIDWEVYARKFQFKSLPSDFKTMKKAWGDGYERNFGLSPWRIESLAKVCADRADALRSDDGMDPKVRFPKQEALLICLGVLSHYVGDQAMPLHTSENHDGQMTNQKGIHAFFESDLVDYLGVELQRDVQRRALKIWGKLVREASGDAFALTMSLIEKSHGRIPELLKIDKETSRKDLAKAGRKFYPMLQEQMALGAIYVALVWKNVLASVPSFEERRFYNFVGAPSYMAPLYERE